MTLAIHILLKLAHLRYIGNPFVILSFLRFIFFVNRVALQTWKYGGLYTAHSQQKI